MVLPLTTKKDPRFSFTGTSGNNSIAQNLCLLSATLNVLLVGFLAFYYSRQPTSAAPSSSLLLQQNPVTFHGGHPTASQTGSCFCADKDHYCMCNPSLAIDLVIRSGSDHIWVVRRKDTGQLACMGGFVEVGESVEQTVLRELQEETGLTVPADDTNQIQLVGVYSDPRRDNRRHTVSVVYVVQFDGSEHPVAADDVKEVHRLAISDIEASDFFADHKTILKDYFRIVAMEGEAEAKDFLNSKGDFATDIHRSVCLPMK